MTGWWVAYATLVVLGLCAVAAAPWLRRDRVYRGLIRSRVLIFCVDGTVFDGLLAERDERTFGLIDVHSRDSGVPIPAAPGVLYIDRARIAYVQQLAAESSVPVPTTEVAA